MLLLIKKKSAYVIYEWPQKRKQLEALMGFQREQRDRINQHIYNINRSKSEDPEGGSGPGSRQSLQSTTFSFQHTPSRTSPVAVDLTHVHHTSEFMKEALKDAVLDFEQCLQGTIGSSATTPTTKNKYNTFPRGNGSTGQYRKRKWNYPRDFSVKTQDTVLGFSHLTSFFFARGPGSTGNGS